MKAVLKEILLKIKKVNDERKNNNENYISQDDTNEEIQDILTDYFLDEFQSGIEIDSYEFLESKFGNDAELIRDAEAGEYPKWL